MVNERKKLTLIERIRFLLEVRLILKNKKIKWRFLEHNPSQNLSKYIIEYWSD